MVQHQIAKKTAPAGEHACNAATVHALTMQAGNAAADLLRGEGVQGCAVLRNQVFDVALVVVARVFAESALVMQEVEVVIQQGMHGDHL